MSNKRSRPAPDAVQATSDDFKLINSVSGKMESRLHRAGITRYAELAALTPAQIAAHLGNPAGLLGRITKENWTGQACELAEFISRPEARPAPDAATGQRYETFAAELVLDMEDQVMHTRLMHVASGDEEQWEGWDDHRMIHFFAERAGLHLPEPPREFAPESVEEKIIPQPEETATTVEPVTAETEKIVAEDVFARAEEIRARVVTAKPLVAATVNAASPASNSENTSVAHSLEVLSGDSRLPSRVLSHQQPFCVRLRLAGTKVASSDPQPFLYTATVEARHLTGKAQTVHQGRGRIELGESAILDVTNVSLPPGAYRLAAAVNLIPGGKHSSPASAFTLQVEGGVLQVY